MKLHLKVKHNETVCHAQYLGSYANIMKLHRKIKHNKKVCHAQELGSYAQGQGHNHVRGKIVPEIVLLINYSSKFDETSHKGET